MKDKIFIPDNINFTCSKCANCCLKYDIPIQKDELEPLNNLSLQLNNQNLKYKNFNNSTNNIDYDYVLTTDPQCPFLDKDYTCKIHKNIGHEHKPKICQLYPFSFTQTPNGFYLYPSFTSSSVIANYGNKLANQNWQQELELFKKLYKNKNLNWQDIYFNCGNKISFEDYLLFEIDLLEILDSSIAIGDIVKNLINYIVNFKTKHKLEISSKFDIDYLKGYNLLWVCLNNVFENNLNDLPINEYMTYLISQKTNDFAHSTQKDFELISKNSNLEFENLIKRYIYCRIFGKLYFASGFNNLSVESGFCHLILISFIGLKLFSQKSIENKELNSSIILFDTIKKIERHYTNLNYSNQTISMLEIILNTDCINYLITKLN